MQLIYAMGEAGRMTFAVAAAPSALPVGAFVYAICDGASAVERIDEETCARMTEREYLTFKQMVNDAWRQELRQLRRPRQESFARRFFAWLSGENHVAQAT
ncbi:MAG: hypothetical protein QOF02_3421 [Blastocatellia bacterium]|jgi:hypothetical protein|nr:hypothetical protein [Blastocatellia bacterium]